jgi:hypothetical protein
MSIGLYILIAAAASFAGGVLIGRLLGRRW